MFQLIVQRTTHSYFSILSLASLNYLKKIQKKVDFQPLRKTVHYCPVKMDFFPRVSSLCYICAENDALLFLSSLSYFSLLCADFYSRLRRRRQTAASNYYTFLFCVFKSRLTLGKAKRRFFFKKFIRQRTILKKFFVCVLKKERG